jgi:hypothetical protein
MVLKRGFNGVHTEFTEALTENTGRFSPWARCVVLCALCEKRFSIETEVNRNG